MLLLQCNWHIISARKRSDGRRGFTLVEVLVVVAIISILIALLLPALQIARESARRTHCASNLKQLALAMHSYQTAQGILPPAGLRRSNSSFKRPASAFFSALPYCEQQALYDQWNFNVGPDFSPNVEITRVPLAIQLCPAMRYSSHAGEAGECGKRPAPSSYALSTGTHYRGENLGTPIGEKERNGAFVMFGPGFYRVGIDDITRADGAASTLLLGELDYGLAEMTDTCYPGGITQWAIGYPAQAWGSTAGVFQSDHLVTGKEYDTFRSDHPEGANFAMVDGGVRFIDAGTEETILDAMATRNGHETIRMQP